VPGQVAIVTGASRGIGLEVVRQLVAREFVAVQGMRDPGNGEAVPGAEVVRLDVTDEEDIGRLAAELGARHGRVDVLVNNAAIHYDTWQRAAGADLGTVREALETNLFGAWRLTQALLPLLRRSSGGRIVNVSSGAGSLAGMGPGAPAYSLSKVGLNALTRMLAAELRAYGILVNSICPGWVATDMGGPGGRPVEEGAAGIVWAATLGDDGPTGGFFRDRKPVPW
jgi:NAD(P)-dependent dehydrogenase (short-subunit alcohol dehydrogenase family)